MAEKKPRLGILGGMGPQATQIFYQRILDRTDAECDQEHLPTLILSDTEMPDRTAAILSGQEETVFHRLLEDARLLEREGCTAIAIPCNTSHYFVDQLQPQLSVPILHMVRETCKVLAARGCRRVGILATDGTIQTRTYQKEWPPTGRPSAWSCPSSTTRSKRAKRAPGRNLPPLTAVCAPWGATLPSWAALS